MILNIIPTVEGGGAEILVKEIHKIFLKKKIDSHLVYFSGKSLKNEINITYLGFKRWNPIVIFHLRKIIKNYLKHLDNKLIIHVHLSWAFFYTALAVIGFDNYKLFYTEHDTTNRRRTSFFKYIDQFFYSKYYRIVCISDAVYKSLCKWVGPKICKKLLIISNGSRIYKIYPRTPLINRLPKLISIGSLTKKKNFSTTITSILKLKNVIDEYVIIGEGPERSKLEKIIRNLKLKKKVKLIGWSDSVDKHLNQSDILLIPSLYEGFGLVAVEGMSTGLSVVASKVDGLSEVLGFSNQSVTFVNQSESINEWEKCILISINKINKLGHNEISKYSSLQAKKFSLQNMVNKYLKLYNQA